MPTALFVGVSDNLANETDARWVQSMMGDTVFHYQNIVGGHMTFMYGKDMSYWDDVMDIFHQYQPLNGASEFLQ